MKKERLEARGAKSEERDIINRFFIPGSSNLAP